MSEKTIGATISGVLGIVGMLILVGSITLYSGFITFDAPEPEVTQESDSFDTDIENEFLDDRVEVRSESEDIKYFVGRSNSTGNSHHSLPDPNGRAAFTDVELEEGYTITAYRSNGTEAGASTISNTDGGGQYQDRAWIGILIGILLVPIGFVIGVGVDVLLGNELPGGGESDA